MLTRVSWASASCSLSLDGSPARHRRRQLPDGPQPIRRHLDPGARFAPAVWTLRTWLERRLRSRLLSAMFWNGVAAALARGLPILGMLVTARILGVEPFGQLGIVYQTIMTCQVFAAAGLGTTATTFVARWRRDDPDKVSRLILLCLGVPLVLGGALSSGLWGGAEWLAGEVLRVPELAPELRIAGVLTVGVALVAVQHGILVGFQAFRDMALANLLAGVATGAGLALGATQGAVRGALSGFGIALVLQLAVNHGLIYRAMRRDGSRLRLRLPWAEFSLLWRFSLPGVLTMALWVTASWAASALLVRQPDGLAQMGLLTAANQWFLALMFIPGVMTQVLLPAYADRLSGDSPSEAGRLALRSAGILLLGTGPVVALLAVLSPAIAALYGSGFADGGPVFAVACAAAGVMAPYGALSNYVVARERMWARLAISLAWSATLLGGAFVLAGWGAIGIGLAMLVAYVVRAGVTYLYARRLMRG